MPSTAQPVSTQLAVAQSATVAIIGAGPIGLETAFELKNRGIDYVHFDKNQIASTIAWFPQGMTFFSSTDRIAICGMPIQTVNQSKATKEQYLAYLRAVAMTFDLRVRTYEEVTSIQRVEGQFELRTRRSNVPGAGGESAYSAKNIVLATGDMAFPRKLIVPGEDLPHVTHYFTDPHPCFRRRVLVVGGKNSAVEAALRCYHAGAHVTISYRGDQFSGQSVKYWLLPELLGRIGRGEIACHYRTTPAQITASDVTLSNGAKVPADFVLLLTGYVADTRLAKIAGVKLQNESGTPVFDEQTMQTSVPGIYVAGTAVAGTQQSYRVFIENCHIHAQRIAASIAGEPPPGAPAPITLPET